MKYVILDMTETDHGGKIKVLGTTNDAGLTECIEFEENDPTQGGHDEDCSQGVLWLQDDGLVVAIPTEGLQEYKSCCGH